VHPVPAARGWAPVSPCGPPCLPPEGTARAGRLRVAGRLAGLVAVLLGAVLGVPLLPATTRERWLRICCRAALRAAGVRLRIVGDRHYSAAGAALVVANHVSWIDVLALDAVQAVRMLAKREVRDWPLIGRLAQRSGALFVDRAGLHALPATVAETAGALRSGAVIGVFPEGTTWCGGAAGRFRRAAFQAAIDAGAPVRPVAIVLRLPGGGIARGAAFVGEQTLWDSLCRVLRLPALVCEVTVLPAILPGAAADRRELALRASAAVTAVTGTAHGTGPAPRRAGRAVAVAARGRRAGRAFPGQGEEPVRRAATTLGPRPTTGTGSDLRDLPSENSCGDLPRPCRDHADAGRGGRGDGRGALAHRQRLLPALGGPALPA
jgi:1-acyl-sn-glycerol-3-phosphate acyltransferase